MDQNSIANKNHYSINHGINVNSVTVQPGNTRVILNTSSHSNRRQYTLTVNNVKDVAGNLIDPQHKTAIYQAKLHGRRGVNRAIAQWMQDYKPENAIDGIIDTTSGSRWEGALSLPDSIVFDMGSKDSIDETRFSFYGWDQGRIYKYSVMASSDGVNWTELVSNQSSFSQEWTVDDFTPVEARFIKLITLNCNQSEGAGLWEAEISGPDETTGVEAGEQVPSDFSLAQNYPNPFNPTTNIIYSIPSSQKVILKVYDELGREVTTLVNSDQPAGNYSVEFNASGLASGIYFYRLQAGSIVQVKKMLLMK